MNARILSALTAATLAATSLSAQAPLPATFKLTGLAVLASPETTPQAEVSFGGQTYYSSPYSGAFETGPNTFGSDFLVWCVDPTHESHFGDVYDVEVSMLTGNLSDTRLGSGGANNYDWAAYLASNMPLDWSSSTNRALSVDYQVAMWDAITNGAFGTSYSALTSGALTALGLSSNFYTTSLLSAHSTFSLAGWQLITEDCVSTQSCGQGGGEQEFLSYNPPGSPQGGVTPEPGTLSLLGTGLAGVIGMGLKRKKKRSA